MQKQTYPIPPNCKFITQEVIDNRIITTFEPEFKRGDIISTYYDSVLSYISIYGDDKAEIITYSVNSNSICKNTQPSMIGVVKFSTDAQKQDLFYAISKIGKQWNAEKCCIEDLKVVPKVGDCVMVDFMTGGHEYFVCGYVGDVVKSKGNVLNTQLKVDKQMDYHFDCNFTVLNKDQFQKELSDFGFEYDFDNDTISKLKWKPKDGDDCYIIEFNSGRFKPSMMVFMEKNLNCINALFDGRIFKTKKECEEAIEKIKNILK